MSVEGRGQILDTLWRGKFYIILVFFIFIAVVFGANYYAYSKGLADQLSQKESDYNGLNDKYNKLSYDHSTLVGSNNDLSRKYTDVNDRYNKLAVDNQDLKASYDSLNGMVNRMHETGGAVIALHYDFYEGGPSNNRKNYLEVTAYNVGDKKADKITIKGQIVNADNSTSVSEQTFNNVDALDKRHVKWEYSTAVRLGSVWYET